MNTRRIVLMAAFFGFILFGDISIAPRYAAGIVAKDVDQNATGVALQALGELRTFIAKSIWFQTDIWNHEEERHGHIWTEQKDIMPLFVLITKLDPHFVAAYHVGGYQLALNFHRPNDGIAYLDEGLHHNPDSIMLHFDKAFISFQLKHYEVAAAESGLCMRLDCPDPMKLLTDPVLDDQVDYIKDLRIRHHAERRLGSRDEEIRALRLLLTLRPDDAYSRRRLPELGLPPTGYTPDEFVKMAN